MVDPDRISWADNLADARPFVKNASNPKPATTLPQALTATQDFRNLSFPSRKYASTAVDSTTHRRALEDRKDAGQDRVKAITSANQVEVVDDYAGADGVPLCQRRSGLHPRRDACAAGRDRGEAHEIADQRQEGRAVGIGEHSRSSTPSAAARSMVSGC